MRSAGAKEEMIRDQVISKIHWGAKEDEVITWLRENHGVSGIDADRLVRQGFQLRSVAIRKRAVMMLLFSGIGILFCGSFLVFQVFGRIIFVGWTALLMLLLLGTSVLTFLKSLLQLFSGRTRGGVDF